uniref:Sodium/solute symporter n=1 Tax=Timema genevievae TaxID=629358 RepID=A0A7R9JS45_TIMGE|nr:unnamed protein product [Timema genevievae]
MLGGLKAVVWTDFLQSFVTVGSSLSVIVIGLWRLGGPQVVWQRSYEGGRLELFNMDPSPFVRSTFWTVTVGMTFAWLFSLAASQGMVQKFISLPDIKSARRSLAIFCVGNITMKTVTVAIGLIIFATYHDCDPLTTKKIKKIDQILPYYVMDTVANVPGLPGLFIAGVFSASLSTLSSTMNCLSGTIYEDFIFPFIRENKRLQSRAHIILKITVAVIGLVCIAMVFIVERLGGVFELSLSLSGITMGTFLGVFTLGMVFPWANAKGALVGTMTSFLLMSWMSLGAQHAMAYGSFSFPQLPLSVESCDDFNVTQSYYPKNQAGSQQTTPDNSEVFILYRVSFMLYSVVGTLLVLIVGLLVSWVTGFTDPDLLDQKLIVPFMKKFVGRRLKDRIRPEEKVLL